MPFFFKSNSENGINPLILAKLQTNTRNVGQCPTWWPPWWRPLFNAAKFGWRPLLECRAVTLPRRQTRWNMQRCPKLTKRSQPLVGRSSPYYGDMWRIYCRLTSFFPIVDACLICEDIARQSCAMVPRWQFLATFLGPAFAASRVQHISDLHSKFALGPRHVYKYARHPICGRWD